MKKSFKLLPLNRTAQPSSRLCWDYHSVEVLKIDADDHPPSNYQTLFDFDENRNFWRPWPFQRYAVLGLGATCITLLCTIESVVVLGLSDGKLLSSGNTQPTV